MTGSDFRLIIAYALFIALIMFVARTRFGYNIVYYGLLLFCITLVLIHYQFIADTLSPISPKKRSL